MNLTFVQECKQKQGFCFFIKVFWIAIDPKVQNCILRLVLRTTGAYKLIFCSYLFIKNERRKMKLSPILFGLTMGCHTSNEINNCNGSGNTCGRNLEDAPIGLDSILNVLFLIENHFFSKNSDKIVWNLRDTFEAIKMISYQRRRRS